MDRCVRALPNDAKWYAAQTSPNSLEGLITLLENHQVTVELMKTTRQENPRASRPDHRPERDRPSKTEMPPRAKAGPVTPPRRHPAADRNLPMCYSCGQLGHMSWSFPGREESMPTEASEGKPCSYRTTCWAHQATAAPKVPVRVGQQDTEALLDSGSVVTLIRPCFTEAPHGPPIPVTCIHGDIKSYPTADVKVTTPQGQFQVRAGVVPDLPMSVLIGRDWPVFERYWPGPGRMVKGNRQPHQRKGPPPNTA